VHQRGMIHRRLAGAMGVLLFLGACGRLMPEGPRDASPLPDVAQVVCDASGARTLTPQVRPRTDGVHVEVDNRLGKAAGFQWEGGGDNAPMGVTELVIDRPPGDSRVGCQANSQDAVASGHLATVQVVDREGLYQVGLGCAEVPAGEDATSSGSSIDYVPGTRGSATDPVAAARIDLAWLRQADDLTVHGYPQAVFRREVEVDREGNAVAFAQYQDDGHGGWLLAGVTTCPGVHLGSP